MYTFAAEWPGYSSDPADIEKLYDSPVVSLDLEWSSNNEPTILGVSDGKLNISVPFYDGLPYFRELLKRNPDVKIAGHNVIGADMFVLSQMGIDLKIENMLDSIVYHYLTSPHLCKGGGKAAMDEEGGASDRRGRGFMNLGSMSSIHTDLPYWKTCREVGCDGSIPCGTHSKHHYNAIDAMAPAIAIPKMKRIAMLRGVDKLYPLHRDLMYVLSKVQEFGVRIDVPYVKNLSEEFQSEKEEIAKLLPFNPDSSKQVIGQFKTLGLENAQEDTIRELVEELAGDAPTELVMLLDYKEIGNGPDRWFQRQYRDPKTGYIKGFMDEKGYVHPHQNIFTSSGRLACSSPNFHNVAKRRQSRKQCACEHLKTEHVEMDGALKCARCSCKQFRGYPIGKKIRRAIIAPDGWRIVRGDFSNAENRNFLYLAGYEPPKGDLHNWMVENIGLRDDDPFAVSLGGARDASKSVTHGADYGEGLQLKDASQLKTPKIRKEIECGARIVYWDWTFKGKIVTFTGANLADRAFGSKTLENRAKANQITSRYIDQTFPKIRELQRKIFKQVETEAAVRPPTGYCTLSYGKDEDRLKTALAIWGSNPIAHYLKLSILESWKKFDAGRPQRLCLSVHDELITYTKNEIDPIEAMNWLREDMNVEAPEMPGFRVPSECSYGPNWRDQTKQPKIAG